MKRIFTGLFTFLFLFFYTGNSKAQINGTYTIDPGAAASASNYKSFTAAVNDLQGLARGDGGASNNTGSGVTGKVIFNVASATFNEQIAIPAISGVSFAKTVTFVGAGQGNTILTFTGTAANPHTLRFNACQYISFKNMTIQNSGTTDGWVVHFMNASRCSVTGCWIEFSNSTAQSSSNSNLACVVVNGSATSMGTSSTNIDSLNIDSSVLNYGFYSVYTYIGSGSSNAILQFRKDSIVNFYYAGFYFWLSGTMCHKILNNYISPRNGVSNQFGVWSWASAASSSSLYSEISNNVFTNLSGYGIATTYPGGNGVNGRIYNNLFGGNTRGATTYISASGAACCAFNGWSIYQNTFYMDYGSGTSYGVDLGSNANGGNVAIKNNIFYNASSSANNIGINIPNSAAVGSVDYNNYYTNYAGGTLLSIGGSAYKAANFRAAYPSGGGLNSLNRDVNFISYTDYHHATNCLRGQNGLPGVVNDFDGVTRPNPPSMGALEPSNVPASDIGVSQIITPAFPIATGSQNLKVLLRNFGSNQVSSMKVFVNLNNNYLDSQVFNFSPALSVCDTISVTFSNQINLLSGTNVLKVYTALSGDAVQANDTAIATLCSAMSGNYTINPSAAASLTNFTSFAAAINSLQCAGVSAPVVFYVSAGTYYEQVSIDPVYGSGSTNTITFSGSGTNATFLTAGGNAALPYTLRFNGCQYVHFRNMSIAGSDPNYAWVVNFLGASFCSVRSCKIDLTGSAFTSSSNTVISVLLNGNATSYSSSGSCNNNFIDSNVIVSGYYGISSFITGSSNINYFRYNSFTNAFQSTIYVPTSQAVKIIGNNIQNRSGNSGSSGINLINSNAPGTGNAYHEIKNNYINNVGSYGIYTQTANGGSTGVMGEVFNNIFGGNYYNSGTVYGVNSTSGYYKYYHNTFVIANNTNAGSMAFYQQNINSNNDIRNNIFAILSATSNNLIPVQIDGSGTVNNLDYNIYYNSTGSNLLKISGTAYNSYNFSAAFPTGGGINSINLNPGFVSASDYHITGVCYHGANLGVTTDIDGQARTTPPDIGADENTSGPTLDAGAVSLVSPTNPVTIGLKTLKVRVKNYGSSALSSLQVNYVLNGGGVVSQTFNFSPSLAQCDTATVTFSTQMNLSSGANSVRVYTSLSNDSFPTNDTIFFNLCTQMAGAYTINASLPASGTNFQSFSAAVNQLMCGGMSGAVSFTVADGTYNESVSLGTITGNSSTNTITFSSQSANAANCVLQGSSNTIYTVQLGGADFVTFNNMGFTTSTMSNARNIELAGGSNNNTFSRCIFNSTQTTSNYHVFENAGVNNYNSYLNCNFNSGAYGFYSSANSRVQKPYFLGNNFNNQTSYAVYCTQSDSIKFINNTVTTNSGNYFYGIYLINAGNAFQISGNKMTGFSHGYGIYFGGSVYGGGSPATRGKIYNNLISGTSGSFNFYPIYVVSSGTFDIYHNTLYNPSSTLSTSNGVLYMSSCSGINIMNNIMYAPGGAYVFTNGGANTLTNNAIDYNDYYTTGSTLVYWAGAFYSNLASWIANVNTQNNSVAGSAKSMQVNFVNVPVNLALADGCITGVSGLGITTDISGTSRSAIPNLGAYEFSSLTNNLAVIGLRAPSGTISTGLQNVVVTIKNVGSNSITSANIRYKFDNAAPVSVSLPAALNPCDTMQILFTGGNQLNITSGLHYLKVYTDGPNGSSDNDKTNDTLGRSICTGGMSGNFTIDASIGSSTTNFQSFPAAIAAITGCGGVSGPVYFAVAAGTYTGQVDLVGISGLSATNTLTFDGGNGNAASRLLTAAGNSSAYYTFRINNLNYVTLKNLTFRGTSGNAWPVQIMGNIGCSFDSIKNCIIDFNTTPVASFNSSNYIGILMNGSATSFSTPGTFNGICIDSNRVLGGYTNVMLYGNNSAAAGGNVITGNTCLNGYQYGLFVSGSQGITIDRNFVDLNTNLSSSSGIYLSNCNYTSGATNYSISRNKIMEAGIYGIFISSSNAPATLSLRGKIVNNTIGGGFRSSDPYGIYISSGYNWDIYHNSVNIDNVATGSNGACLYIGNCCSTGSTLLTVKNNIFAITGMGSTANLFYFPNGYPYAVINRDSFNNNLFWYNGATSQTNIAYTGGTYLTPVNIINHATYNAGSVIGNPIFYGNLDLRPADPSFNMAPIASVNTDIEGTTRSLPTDAGAYEMPAVADDIGISALVSPAVPYASGTQNVTVTLKNFGNTTITSANVSYTINGGSPVTIGWTGSVAPGASVNVTFSGANAFNFAPATLYTIRAWTSLPNGNTDARTANDTLMPFITAPASCGNYTIDKTIAASATNFTGFTNAVNILNYGGITCPVYIEVKSGTYNEQVVLNNVIGSSAINTITFDGTAGNASTRVLTWDATQSNAQHTFRLNSSRYLYFKNLTMNATNVNFGWALHIKDAKNIYLSNCQIKMDGLAAASTNSNLAAIVINNHISSLTGSQSINADSIFIDSCKIIGGYYGIAYYCNNSNAKYLYLTNSSIDSSYYMGIYGQYWQFKVINNKIRMRYNGTSSNYGAYFYFNYASSGNFLEFRNNVIQNAGTYGVYFYYASHNSATNVPANKFHNNMIEVGRQLTGASAAYGVYAFGQFTNWELYHNSIQNNAPTSGANRSIYLTTGSKVRIRNNIFSVNASSSYSALPLEVTAASNVDSLTNNIYYNSFTSNKLIQIGSNVYGSANINTSYPSGGGAGSLNVIPPFVTSVDLHLKSNCWRGPSLNTFRDLDNEVRPSSPNLGADELYDSLLTSDNIGIDAILSPQPGFSFGSQQVRVRIRNYGKNNVTSCFINFRLNGGTVVSQAVTGINLNTCDTVSAVFTVTPTVNSCLQLYAYTTLPNGNQDSDSTNDGINTNIPFNISGNFTIDPAGSGVSNFTSYNACAAYLSCGVLTGPVFVSVAPGTYNEQVSFSNIQGLSASNTLVFDGGNASNNLITYAPNSSFPYTIRFDNCNYITLKNLSIRSTDINYGWTLHIKDATNFKVTNCRIMMGGSALTSSSGSLCPVVINGSNTNITTSSNINDQVTIDSCYVLGGYYGLWAGGQASVNKFIYMNANTFDSAFYYGTNVQSICFRMRNNNINMRWNGAVNSYGCSFSSCYNYVSGNYLEFSGNRVRNAGQYGVYMSTVFFNTGTARNPFYNNMIGGGFRVSGGTQAFAYYGTSNLVGWDFYHNTFNMDATSISGNRAFYIFGIYGNYTRIKNNIFAISVSAANAIPFEIGNSTTLSYFDSIGYNNYYSSLSGTPTLGLINGVAFTAASNLTAAHTSNGGGVGSVAVNPSFISNTDVHITTISMKGQSMSGMVAKDYDNEVRRTPPDMGADEYYFISRKDFSVIRLVNPAAASCLGGKNLILTLRIKNAGNDTIILGSDTAFVSCQVKDPSNNTVTYGPALVRNRTFYPGDSLDVNVANNLDMAGYGNYNFTGYVKWKGDTVSNNDTLKNVIRNATNPNPQNILKTTTSVCIGDSVKLSSVNSLNVNSRQWFYNNSIVSGQTDSIYYAKASGTYFCRITSGAGCNLNTDTVTINIKALPSATFNVSRTALCNGDSAKLSIVKLSSCKYNWMFNGSNINGATDSIYYAKSAGNYNVFVKDTVTGCSALGNQVSLTINPNPAALITFPNNGKFCAGDSLKLSSNSAGGLTWQWSVGGSNISGATDSIYYAKNSGTYKVLITNSTTGCTTLSAGASIIRNPLPSVSISFAGSSSKCTGDSIKLSSLSGTGKLWQWYLNGSAITGAKDSLYFAKTTGTYKVVITDSISGCLNTSSNVSLTFNAPPTALATFVGSSGKCVGDSLKLSANRTGPLKWQWILNGSNLSGATDSLYFAKTTGIYKVTITDSITGCTSTSAGVSLTFNAPPSAPLTYSTNTKCAGDSIKLSTNNGSGLTWQWNYNGSNISGATDSIYYAKNSGTYKVTVSSSSSGCSSTSATVSLTFNALPVASVASIGSTSRCVGDSVKLITNNGSGLTRQWQLNGSNISGGTDSIYYAKASGTYRVVITNATTGCSNTSSGLSVTINALPSASINPSSTQTICAGDSIKFSSGSAAGFTRQWLLNGSNISGATDSIYFAKSAGSYKVIITQTSTGCSNTSAVVSLNLNALPAAVISYPQLSSCSGDSIKLGSNSNAGLSWQWILNGTNISGATDSVYYAKSSGSYKVKITNNATGCNAVATAVSLTFNALPNAIISYSGGTSKCAGDSVRLSSNNASGLSWQWSLNGSAIGGATDSFYYAKNSGTYTVNITNNATGCYRLASGVSFTFNALPSAPISFIGSGVVCAGDSIHLSGSNAVGIKWQWKNNNANINGAIDSLYYAKVSGNYNVLVTDTTTGCSALSSQVSLTVNPLPSANITFPGTYKKCVGDSLKLSTNNAAGITWQWKANGTDISGANDSLYVTNYTGTFSVRITDNSTGCQNLSNGVYIVFNNNPVVSIAHVGSGLGCTGDSILMNATGTPANGQYQWYRGGISLVGATKNSIYVKVSGNYSLILKDTSTGCQTISNNDSITIFSRPTANVSFMGNGIKCLGDTLKLSSNAASGLTYQWYKNGNPISGALDSTYPVTTTGAYQVLITNGNNCSKLSNTANILIDALPNVNVSVAGNTQACGSDTLYLTAPVQTGYTYIWKESGLTIPGGTSATLMTLANGMYTVTVTNGNGCKNTSAPVIIKFKPKPTPPKLNGAKYSSLCLGDSLRISVSPLDTGVFTFKWKFNSGTLSSATDSFLIVRNGGIYSAEVTANNGCSSESFNQIYLTVHPQSTTSLSVSGNTTICNGDSVSLTASNPTGIANLKWTQNNVVLNTVSNPLYVKTSGKFIAQVKDVNGCTSVSAPLNIVVRSLPNPSCMVNMSLKQLSTTNFVSYQWYFNGSPIPGETNQTIIPAQNGDYFVEVTDVFGCKGKSPVRKVTWLVGIQHQAVADLMEVYPNPSNGIFRLDWSPSCTVQILMVSDLAGREIKVQPQSIGHNQYILDLTNDAPGIYIVHFILNDQPYQVRLVKY